MRIKKYLQSCDEASRREFISQAARGMLGLSVMGQLPMASALGLKGSDDPVPLQPATARNVIYLFMSGGMSQLDTFDPKPGAETQGPVEAIGSNVDGIQLSQYLPMLAGQMDKATVINSLHSTQGAHAQGQYYMHTSYAMRGTIRHPSVGAWLSRMAGKSNPTLPGHVLIGGSINTASGGFLEPNHYPLPIGDPSSGLKNAKLPEHVSTETFHRRLERVEQMNQAFAEKFDQKKVRAYGDAYAQAIKLMNSKDLLAFDLSQEPDAILDAYGRNRFGQGCALARRLVEHGTRYVEVVMGGWDTHIDNFDRMEELCPTLDRALASLLADLEARGLLEETLVVLATEFGRTPRIVEGRNGRNHFPKAFSGLLAGGGIKGGVKYGKTDATGEFIEEDGVTIPDFNATIAFALGLPTDHVMHSPSKRPFTVADKGRPLTHLFA
ncbi:MAG: DUF1501 domain-containing protein [Planctomycetota bacterium]|jgi:hypothetical protein